MAQQAAATREALGPTLVRLVQQGLDIVVVDADLGVSTTAAVFGKEYPDRFFTVGVAEQNMIGVAAGLAAAGKIAFASTFAVFAPGRCLDQLRVAVAYPQLNVKLVASHGGVVTGEDGFSAQALEDLGVMCAIPGFRVVFPADVVEAAQAIEVAARTPGPFYIRCVRPKIPVIYDESYRFGLGVAHVIRPGNDVTVIAVGEMVWQALLAADRLAEDGIECRVINMASLKPLDEEAIIAAATQTGAIVTAEDHQVRTGLGSMVAQVVAAHHPVPMAFVGMNDAFGESGRWDELMQHYGLTCEAIAQKARELVARKTTAAGGTKPRARRRKAVPA